MKSSLINLIVALLVCVVAIVGYGMWYGTISAKSTSVAAIQNQIDAKTETVNRIAATRATLASVASDEAVVQGYFVPESGVVSFIDSLETHGKTLGSAVSVLSVSAGGTTAKPTLLLSATVTGTFDAVMRTVGAIEYAPYDLSITAFSVAQNAKDSWTAALKVVVGSVPATRAATTTSSITAPTLGYTNSAYAYF